MHGGRCRGGSKKPAPPSSSPLDRYVREAEARSAEASSTSAGSLWLPSSRLADAARDVRASQIDDLLTIVVAEQASAVSTGSTKTQRTSSAKSNIAALAGVTKATGPLANLAGVSGDTQLAGQGTTSRSTALSTTLTARVIHVLPNGALVIEAAKDIQINSERQTITVRGVVRPADIDATNSVRSNRLGQLEVRVNGKGVVGDAVRRPFFLYRLILGPAAVLSYEDSQSASRASFWPLPGAGDAGAPQGPRRDRGRSRQPVDRLWPGRRARGHRGPPPDDVLRAEPHQSPGADGHHRLACRDPRHQHRRRPGDRDAAAFAQPGMRIDSTDRRDRRRAQSAGRHPGPHVAARRRRASLCRRAGTGSDRRIFRRARRREPDREPPDRRTRSRQRDCRARRRPPLRRAESVRLQLRQSDFTTSARIVEAIEKRFGGAAQGGQRRTGHGRDPCRLRRALHRVRRGTGGLTVEADRPARVVVNERTGTIVLGKDVRIAPVAILHGNLSVEIQTTYAVSQPNPLSQGSTEVVPQTSVTAKEEKARNIILKQGATVEELVRALAAIGSTPRDVIAILQNLRSAGALEAEIEVI